MFIAGCKRLNKQSKVTLSFYNIATKKIRPFLNLTSSLAMNSYKPKQKEFLKSYKNLLRAGTIRARTSHPFLKNDQNGSF